MSCSGRLAEAYEFAVFWCMGSLISRMHDGGNLSPKLVDSQASFRSKGVRAGAGMVVYNVSDGSQGTITDVTDTEIVAALSGGTRNHWRNGDTYRVTPLDAFEIAQIEHYLEVSVAPIYAALAAAGACDCALSAWGAQHLKHLNIISAAGFYTCTCSMKLSDEERAANREWVAEQLRQIRTGEIDLCEGGTGKDYPAFGDLERAGTDFAAARIIANRAARTGS